MNKFSDLLPTTKLQPHQERVLKRLRGSDKNLLLLHSLGSGKTLTSIAAAEQEGKPYTAVVPAALRPNFRGEQAKFTDQKLPGEVISYNAVARGYKPKGLGTLLFDEAHRLRSADSAQSINARRLASKADRVALMSGTPVVNDPSDFAPLMSILTKEEITPEQFRERYVEQKEVSPGIVRKILGYTPGIEEDLVHTDELASILKGHIDYYAPDKPVVPVKYEDHPVEMSSEQSDLHHAMFGRLSPILRWKLRWQFPLNHDELRKMTSFLSGPRQVGLSTLPFMRGRPDPYKAYQQSPKLQKAMELLQERFKDNRAKALVFSSFISAGLEPYAAALERAKIPYGVFSGKLTDNARKQLVDDYNRNKLRVALLGPSGTEGLSFKGTNLIQLLDPAFQPVRGRQSVGRGLRLDSHIGLPDDLRNVTVQRFQSRLPLGFMDRILSAVGFDREANRRATDDYLTVLSEKKDRLNKKLTDLLQRVGSET